MSRLMTLVRDGWPIDAEVLAGQLPGRLDRLGAARGEEHPVEVAGGQAGQPLGQLDGPGVGVGPQREVGQLGRLLGGRLGQLGAAVADLAGEQAGQAVEVALAVLVPHVGALAPHHDRDLVVGSVGAEAGEVHPQVAGLRRRSLSELVRRPVLARQVRMSVIWSPRCRSAWPASGTGRSRWPARPGSTGWSRSAGAAGGRRPRTPPRPGGRTSRRT